MGDHGKSPPKAQTSFLKSQVFLTGDQSYENESFIFNSLQV